MQSDKLVPYFMSLAFPAGAVGLVIAAIMAASLSSIDSAINSCTSVAVIDFYNRLWKGRNLRPEEASAKHDPTQVMVSRILTGLFGAAGTILACNVSRVGSLLEINAKVVNAFTGPLFGMAEPPRLDPRGLPIGLGLLSAILAIARIRPFDRLPLNAVLLCLAGFTGALVARGSAYPGRFSAHVIPVATALTVSGIALLVRSSRKQIKRQRRAELP